ncbi:hypothetical protein AB8989_06635 [Yersinia hibernica]|uniref:Uncharacterized protein n=1 Tax=Yersinia hibernica TaxID=2339259 RepID=A0ABX5R050_9GAMM|nr:hypothetical protein [Yersinia hibernica]QAX78957.1 hypothetical protein D5F51_10545 [Yersinia hibernica]
MMNDVFSGYLDVYKNLLIILIFILCFVRVGGISFFIKLFLRAIRVNYTDNDLKKHDDAYFNVQLFRLFNGVNVKSESDVKIICDALDQNKIERSLFRFSGFFGMLGVRRQIRFEVIMMSILGVLCFGAGLNMLYAAPKMKVNYVTYTYKGESVLISKYRVYNYEKNNSYNKKDCQKLIPDEDNINYLACEYLLSSDKDIKEELQDAIASEMIAIKVYFGLIIGFFFMGAIIVLGYTNFRQLNKIVCDIKEENRNNLNLDC